MGQPSVVSCLIQTCRDIHATVLSRQKLPANLLQLTFNVLTNISSSPECRALVWKANLLELFAASADRGQHPKRSKLQTSLLEYWLRLMLALSFHTDGQLNILKLRDIFDVLIELYSSKTFPKLVLDIIRNLCFHAPSKNRISSCNPVVNILLLNLGQKDKAVRMDCSIAVLSLLCNNQKAKVHLKGAGLGKCVQNTLDRLTLEGDVHSADDMKYKRHLEDVLQIMQG
uniref:PUL domain-containing protein n=1 Tax=Ciona savignyi TaxID=51511 RepID=H2YGG6_CIOSA